MLNKPMISALMNFTSTCSGGLRSTECHICVILVIHIYCDAVTTSSSLDKISRSNLITTVMNRDTECLSLKRDCKGLFREK